MDPVPVRPTSVRSTSTGDGVGRLAVDQDAARVYVLDTGTRRVTIWGLDGTFQSAWPDLDGAAVAVGPDGRVYVADRERNAIGVYDAAGALLFRVGQPGTDEGSFSIMTDASVSPDGLTLAVGDLNGLRVQLFDLAAASATESRSSFSCSLAPFDSSSAAMLSSWRLSACRSCRSSHQASMANASRMLATMTMPSTSRRFHSIGLLRSDILSVIPSCR